MDPVILSAAIVILLFSVIVHEVMHGYAALRFGDRTAENAGRLTLNPIPHIDPIGTVLVPLSLFILGNALGTGGILFGWAKPVPVNPLNFSNIRKGELVVSAAGILANLGLALVASILMRLFFNFENPQLSMILYSALSINVSLAVFNLLPIPPLDGSKIVMSLLPYEQARSFQKVEQYGPLILLGLLMIPGLKEIFSSFIGIVTGIIKAILLIGF